MLPKQQLMKRQLIFHDSVHPNAIKGREWSIQLFKPKPTSKKDKLFKSKDIVQTTLNHGEE